MSVSTLVATVIAVATPTPRPTSGAGAAAAGQPSATTPADMIAGTGATGMAIIAGIALFVGYLGSLALHPNAKCGRCKGAGRHRGSVFTYATRPCTSCQGRGVQPRLGRRLFFRGSH